MDYLADTIDFYELFDRLIVATARFLDVPLLTSDKEIRKSQIVKGKGYLGITVSLIT